MRFELPLPPPLNHTYRSSGGRWYKVKKARDWEKEAGYLMLPRPKKPLNVKVYVGIHFYLKRKRDIDAGEKIVLDLLEKQNIIVNDDLIYHKNTTKEFDKKNPRVEIEIEKI